MPTALPDRQTQFNALNDILCATYGAPFIYHSRKDPLSELIGSLLSHRTKNAITRAAYQQLKTDFPTWEEVIEADPKAIEESIRRVTFPEAKAPRIQQVLRDVRERSGALSLEFLKGMTVPEARAWLQEIRGVGSKTSAAVLAFSTLRMPALVVDTHHIRVAQRTGLVPPKMGIDKGAYALQALIPDDWTFQMVYDNHQGYMRHGQRICLWKNPLCGECSVRAWCAYGREREGAEEA